MFYKDDVPNTHFLLFDDIEDMVEATTKYQDRARLVNLSAFTNASWIGREIKNWEDVMKKSKETWDEGLQIYSVVMDQVRSEKIIPPQSIKRRARWDYEEGEEFSLDKLEKGQPFLRTMKRARRPGPMSATVLANVSVNGGVSAKEMIMRGIAATALTELMEDAGYRVELWAGDLSTNCHYTTKKDHFSAVRLKRTQDPLDVNSMIVSTSAWYFRTVFFMAEFVGDDESLRVAGGFGGAGPIGSMLKHITPDEQAMVCEQVQTYGQAVTWIKEQIANLK